MHFTKSYCLYFVYYQLHGMPSLKVSTINLIKHCSSFHIAALIWNIKEQQVAGPPMSILDILGLHARL